MHSSVLVKNAFNSLENTSEFPRKRFPQHQQQQQTTQQQQQHQEQQQQSGEKNIQLAKSVNIKRKYNYNKSCYCIIREEGVICGIRRRRRSAAALESWLKKESSINQSSFENNNTKTIVAQIETTQCLLRIRRRRRGRNHSHILHFINSLALNAIALFTSLARIIRPISKTEVTRAAIAAATAAVPSPF